MLKTYITTVPLQGKLDPMLYQRERAEAPTATCFPIVQVMRDTLEPGDTVQLLAIRQENADTARNYQRLLEELAQLGIAEDQVHQLHLPEDQRPETLIGLCRDLVDALPQVTRVYACITYGSKSIPMVTLTALTCARWSRTTACGISCCCTGMWNLRFSRPMHPKRWNALPSMGCWNRGATRRRIRRWQSFSV